MSNTEDAKLVDEHDEKAEQLVSSLIFDCETAAGVSEATELWRHRIATALRAAAAEGAGDMEIALTEIKQWADAYPESVFPDPTAEELDEVAKLLGPMMDRLHGSWGRHIAKGIGEIAAKALPEPPATDEREK